MVRILPLMSKY